MSTLSSLKLVAARKPARPSALVPRRHKLSNKLWEQLQLQLKELGFFVCSPGLLRQKSLHQTFVKNLRAVAS